MASDLAHRLRPPGVMRWRGGRRSRNIEDRRGLSGVAVGGGIGGVVLVVAALLLGVDPDVILNSGDAPAPAEQAAPGTSASGDPLYDFSSVVLASTEDVWHARFRNAGSSYAEPTLVVFDGATPSACGLGQTALGPFYCPRDASVYLDLSFFRALRERLGAPGDFA
ncbi:MAG: neutral zinc metallopeptidase, partial [Longimicrobiales bacterium]